MQTEKELSLFIKINKCTYDGEKEIYNFYDANNSLLFQTKNVLKILDPTYDEPFKKLFSCSKRIYNYDCHCRTMSLICSLLFSMSNKKLDSIEYLNNEIFFDDKKYVFTMKFTT